MASVIRSRSPGCGGTNRERYRKRFGIEASFRQLRQARIYTCTRQPRLRLLFVAVALVLRNLWVWIHHTFLAEGDRDNRTLHIFWQSPPHSGRTMALRLSVDRSPTTSRATQSQ